MTHLIIVIIVILIFFTFIRNLCMQRGNAFLELIPGPNPFPLSFIGNILQLLPLNQVRRNFFQLFKEYPVCFKFVAFSQWFVVLNSPTVVQSLLKSSNLGHLSKSFIYDILKPFMTSGLIVANGSVWQPHRKMLKPSMSYQSLRSYMKLINIHSMKLILTLDSLFADGQPHAINTELNCSFLEIICEMITGSKAAVDTKDVIDYHHNFQKWKATAINRLVKPWLLIDVLWNLHPMSKEYCRSVEKLHSIARKMLTKNKEMDSYVDISASEEINNNFGKVGFTNMLSELRKGGVPEEQILEEIHSMLLAGHETVATTMHFFCFLLASKPEFQEECHKEVDGVFNDPMLCNNNMLNYDALSTLKYVERCILETLRLFPPVYAYIRQLDSALSININDRKVELSSGTNVVVIPSALQMNPEYFPNPKEFNPDRFLPEESIKRPIGCYIPFSEGPRGCLGRKFAIMELKVYAAFILYHFELETKDKLKDIPILPYVTLTPKRDYIFNFKRRHHSSR